MNLFKKIIIGVVSICFLIIGTHQAEASDYEIDQEVAPAMKDCVYGFLGVEEGEKWSGAQIVFYIFVVGPICASVGISLSECANYNDDFDYTLAIKDDGSLNFDYVESMCSDDSDEDTIVDHLDNCPGLSNKSQKDTDKDKIGDACDEDKDNDGILNDDDNCPLVSNEDQEDLDQNGVGDACDDDFDPEADDDLDGADGIPNDEDNCPLKSNPMQLDYDNDGIGNICDPCPSVANSLDDVEMLEANPELCEDDDSDGVPNLTDICNGIYDTTNESEECLNFNQTPTPPTPTNPYAGKTGGCSLVTNTATASHAIGYILLVLGIALAKVRRKF